ncbi:hypothetical protein M427DRAFT_154259 [Gonapodya prolifera JEL478]|uniref:Ankyrin n=1 Tax=Gonapodya prolifera (strain JEL478) TaxID=1344416 RepID=A0A139AK39_GONPJ|nr:hypothetical protein M427DRAFT_154259 [Gonapodya prolifera JEL478]|eukprot:KXS16873.1 hypothetical protein M427DRAFT_154259 [Gonapodya prolifera JEL478]
MSNLDYSSYLPQMGHRRNPSANTFRSRDLPPTPEPSPIRGRSRSRSTSPSPTAPSNHRKSSRGPPPSLQLLAAVESKDAHAVRTALAAGADPNARKLCTLTCTVYAGSKTTLGKSGLLAALSGSSSATADAQEKGTGASETLTVTAQGESALALAILHDSPACVHELLLGGADPNLPAAWRIARGRQVWTRQTWANIAEREWDLAYRFNSHLELALGVGTGRDASGDFPLDYLAHADPSHPAEVWCSNRGAAPLLADPSPDERTFMGVPFVPNIEIVEELVRGGAKVSAAARAAVVKCLEDPSRLRAMEVAMERRSAGQDLRPANGSGVLVGTLNSTISSTSSSSSVPRMSISLSHTAYSPSGASPSSSSSTLSPAHMASHPSLSYAGTPIPIDHRRTSSVPTAASQAPAAQYREAGNTVPRAGPPGQYGGGAVGGMAGSDPRSAAKVRHATRVQDLGMLAGNVHW